MLMMLTTRCDAPVVQSRLHSTLVSRNHTLSASGRDSPACRGYARLTPLHRVHTPAVTAATLPRSLSVYSLVENNWCNSSAPCSKGAEFCHSNKSTWVSAIQEVHRLLNSGKMSSVAEELATVEKRIIQIAYTELITCHRSMVRVKIR